ncbi:MAG: class I SAM-dependent methyltransferase [Acidimicrobiales bacterium]
MTTDQSNAPAYDSIGVGYATHRRTDERINVLVLDALGDSERVLNVGCGAGSYEPGDRQLVGLDPSALMLAQRPPGSGPPVRGDAGALPFEDNAFDAVMAMLTVHHWPDRRRGYTELCRVARRRVVLAYEPSVHNQLWVVADYFPEIAALDDTRSGYGVDEVVRALGAREALTVPVPWDCTDGFIMAYWRRPEAYLDPQVRQSTSGFSSIDPRALDRGLRRLRADLESGEWATRYGYLRDLDEFDAGLRLVVSTS